MIDEKPSISNWAVKSSEIILEYFHYCESTLSTLKGKMDYRLSFVLLQLAISCQQASGGALLLIRNNYLWEAEMLIRAVLEGSIKYLFLCTGNEDDRNLKAIEYWEKLPDIYELRRSDKAFTWLSQVENPRISEFKPINEVIMEKKKSDEIQSKYPKKTRDSLRHKWSIRNILLSFQNSEESINQDIYKSYSGALFGYDIASHIIHQDGDCIGLKCDRTSRNTKRRLSLEKAHAAREIMEIVTLAHNRATITGHILKVETKSLALMEEQYKPLVLEMNEAKSSWSHIEYDNHIG